MSDDNPFAPGGQFGAPLEAPKKGAASGAAVASGDENPFAPGSTFGAKDSHGQVPAESVTEDVLRTIPAAAARGTVGMVTQPGTMSGLFDSGAQWLLKKMLPEDSAPVKALDALNAIDKGKDGKSIGDKNSMFPSYDTAISKVEDKTGPLYKPEGTAAKVVGGAVELAPTLATQGYSLPGWLLRSVAGGAGGEAGRQGGEALEPYLPEKLKPLAQPGGNMLGMLAGVGAPGAAARAVAPVPSAEQAAVIKYLRHNAPDVLENATAGQITNRPWLMSAENRIGRFKEGAQAEKQGDVFTKTVHGFASDTGGPIGKIYENGAIRHEVKENGKVIARPWQDAVDAIHAARGEVANIKNLEPGVLADMNKTVDRITTAGSGKKPTITGKQYQAFRDELQNKIDSASNGAAKNAYVKMREALDANFDLSQPDRGARLANLRADKVTYEEIANRNPSLSGQITPQEVLTAAVKKRGAKAVNEGQSASAELAQNASKVMQDLPKANYDAPAWMDLGQSAAAAAANNLWFGGHNPMEASVLGHLLSQSTANVARGANSMLFGNKAAQNFIKQNAENPQSVLFANPANKAEVTARILANPALYPLLEDKAK